MSNIITLSDVMFREPVRVPGSHNMERHWQSENGWRIRYDADTGIVSLAKGKYDPVTGRTECGESPPTRCAHITNVVDFIQAAQRPKT